MGRLTKLLILLGSLVLAGLSTIVSLWSLGTSVASLGFALVVPEDPGLSMRNLNRVLSDGSLSVPDPVAASILEAGRLDPLADEYLLLAALQKRGQTVPSEYMQLLELARTRDPRNRIARILLVEAYLLGGEAGKAAAEIAALDLLEKELQNALIPTLVAMINEPSARDATIDALANSRLREPLARALAREGASPQLIVRLADVLEGSDLSRETVSFVNSLVMAYVDAGDLYTAETLWRHFYGLESLDLGTVTDPDFSGFPPPPFGWLLGNQSGGVAEIRNNSLGVAFYGRTSWVIARQLLRLDPGTYRLAFDVAPGTSEVPNLAWRIDCLGSGAALFNLPLDDERFLGLVPTDTFTVDDQNCSGQWLILAGKPGDDAFTRSIEITEVSITSLDAS